MRRDGQPERLKVAPPRALKGLNRGKSYMRVTTGKKKKTKKKKKKKKMERYRED